MEPGVSSRMAAYRRPDARRLLSRILEEGHLDVAGQDDALKVLLDMGIIRETAREARMKDPETGATSFSLIPSCPHCGSRDLAKEELMEHPGCGYVGRLSDFTQSGECIICPRCGRAAELRRIGSWFYCRSCGRSFHSPRILAQAGGRTLPAEDLELTEVRRYELSPDLIGEVRAILSLYSSVAERLRSLGYSVEESAAVRGISGVRQTFDVVARKGEHVVYVDVMLGESEPMLLASMMGHIVKYFDSAANATLLLIHSPRSELPRQLLSSCCPRSIRIVEGEDLDDLVKAMEVLEV
ncbi:MAG: hypothetical protein ACP5GT_00245 [Conexivisphaera sp.]